MEQSTSTVERGGVIGAREEVLADEQSDARIERMQRVAVLYGEITAATREFLAALAHSDRHRDWEGEGFRSCAEWLAWQIGVTRGTASQAARNSRTVPEFPRKLPAGCRVTRAWSGSVTVCGPTRDPTLGPQPITSRPPPYSM